MTAPGIDHAPVVMNLIARLLPAVSSLGECLFTAPLDVFFGEANTVEPDPMALLPERFGPMHKRGIEGAPNIPLEPLSPSTPLRDRGRKRTPDARGDVSGSGLASPDAGLIEILVLNGNVYRVHLQAGDDKTVAPPLLPDRSFPASAAFASKFAS